MTTDANGYETLTPDAACDAALNTLVVGMTFETVDTLAKQKGKAGRIAPQSREYGEDMRRLTLLLLRRVTEGASAVNDGDLAQASGAVNGWMMKVIEGRRDRKALMKEVRSGAPYSVLTLSHVLDHAAMLEFGASVRVEPAKRGKGFVLRWKRLTPEATQLGLLPHVLHGLHDHAQESPLIALEVTASEWWFKRWCAKKESDDERREARKIRQREWSLIDRKSFALDYTVLEMCHETRFLGIFSPKARRMAESARRSRLGVFVARERSGADVMLEDVGEHERMMLRDHDPARPTEPGTLILGRLYPWDDERYLRSPGAFVLEGKSVPPPEKFVEWAGILLRERVPLAVALESVVTSIRDRKFAAPRDVAPAGSREEARKTLDALRAAMERTGMFTNPDSDGALWLESTGEKAHWTIFGWEADLAMANWVEDLMTVAGIAQEVRR
jgi:hypothetical protein